MAIIKSIIFSMNRALQLDAVLRSFYIQCQDGDRAQVNVLYLATDDMHIRQYRELAEAYPNVRFLFQGNFKKNLLSILSPYPDGSTAEKTFFFLGKLGNTGFPLGSLPNRIWRRTSEFIQKELIKPFVSPLREDEYILFLVDDNIFTRAFSLGDAIRALDEQNDLIGFSLRLGENTAYCYVNDRPQSLPTFAPLNAKVFKFDWTSSEQDFGYPAEVSSSIYRLRDILPVIAGSRFENPNELEERMAYHAKSFRRTHPYLGCYQCSVAFCNPVNKVQTVIPNRTGEDVRYEVDELAARFTKGERILVEAYNGFIPNACHQEVELIFERREDPQI